MEIDPADAVAAPGRAEFAKGSPAITERAWIVPPASRIGPITDAERENYFGKTQFAAR